MKKLVIMFATVLVASLVLSVDCSGQCVGRRGNQGASGERLYNPDTVETISGVVVSVDRFSSMKDTSQGVHAVVKTDKETISVHLGPAWFIDNQETKIATADRLAVKGSRIMFQGKPAIIAAEITKDGQTLTLRDASGMPVWRAWRRR